MVERASKPTKPEWILALEEQADEEHRSGVNRPTVTLPDIKNFKPLSKRGGKQFSKKKPLWRNRITMFSIPIRALRRSQDP